MKYSNLIDAVTGKIYEGKSYKKNDDEDTKSKKEKDQERKEAGKNKKQPVEESETIAESKNKKIADLEKKVSDIEADKKDALNVLGTFSKAGQEKLKLAKEALAKAKKELTEGKSFKRNDDDDQDADDKKKEDKQKRDAKKQPVSESVFTEDEDHANSLSEAYGRGWAILPATVALYNKKVVDITTAASEWASDKYPTSILVCHKNENGRDRMLFLSSSGDCRNQYKVGQSSETYHDQTGASKGVYTVLNIVVFQSGEMIYKANEQGLNKKASVAVFK